MSLGIKDFIMFMLGLGVASIVLLNADKEVTLFDCESFKTTLKSVTTLYNQADDTCYINDNGTFYKVENTINGYVIKLK